MAGRRRVLLFVVIAIVLGGAAAWYVLQGPAPAGTVRSGAPAPVPVQVAAANRHDLPIYLIGLGTVQASFTISIRAQVDGQLVSVLFTEGQHVKKGDVLAKIDDRIYKAALEQARAKKAQDEAQLANAKLDLDRYARLAQTNSATRQQYDTQKALVAQLEAQIESDQGAIESAETQLEFTNITAPSDGRMGVRLVDPGNLVRSAEATSIATLTLTQPTAVLFTLPARALEDVRAAMARGPVEVTAFSQDNLHVLDKGTLLLIDNLVDQQSATMRLKAMFPNEEERLWPGDFVNARVLLETRKNVLTVPSVAIQRGPDGIFTWVLKPDNIVEARPVQAGPTTGDETIITTGLADGDRVVVNGQYKLRKNARVTVNEPPPPASAKRDSAS